MQQVSNRKTSQIKYTFTCLSFVIDGLDFVGISGQQLTFGPAVSSIAVPVDIIDDDLLEEMIESFYASLTSDVPRLELSPDEATVDITDNESK